jgi:hypothetical protein
MFSEELGGWQCSRRRLFTKKEVHMQKLCSKLGLVVVLSCLTLVIGLVASSGSASAHGSGHHPVSKISPRISMKVLSGRFKFHGHYLQRVLLSGFGFDDCNSCANASTYDGCNSECNSGCDNACNASCSYYYPANACGNACSQACGSSNGCANYNACGTDIGSGYPSCTSNCGSATGSIGVGTISGGHPSCASNCGSVGAAGIDGGNDHPSCASNCGSASGSIGVGTISGSQPSCTSHCGNAAGTIAGSASCTSYDACGNASSCDCANVQSNLPIYGQDLSLSQVPVNAFGEFSVIVLIQVPTHPSTASYRMWAINRYNNDCSNIVSQSW